MNTVFHAGELAVQAKAGVQAMARRVGQGIKTEMPSIARAFLQEQSMVVVASSDAAGRVWASVLSGAPGFLQAVDKQTVQIEAAPQAEDPLYSNLQVINQIGLLVIDLATRRRMRINGSVKHYTAGSIEVEAQQVYSNCPKYIQARRPEPGQQTTQPQAKSHRSSSLTPQQQQWLAQTDTFFIATVHPSGGADASHRGGNPGFVSVIDARSLVWPDYAGNTMFNTLGNIAANPQAGLLVLDFERGNTLQLTGQASIIWDTAEVEKYPGAERLVSFQIEEVIETEQALPLSWQFESYSPFNP